MARQSKSLGPININSPIRFNDALPEAVDVVVIGGGIVGVSAALNIASEGNSVLLLEKGRLAAEQSSRNWGWVRQQGRDEAELPIMMEANRLWGELDKQVRGRTGFKRAGVLYLASSQVQMEKRLKWLDVARQQQLKVEVLSAQQVANKIDQGNGTASHKWVGGTLVPDDARAEPWQAVPALGELAQTKGVLVRENCAARMIETTNGQVTGVTSEAGSIRCEQVVVAGGAWSSLLLRRHGISIPQLSVRTTVSATKPLPEIFSGNAADEQLAFRRREDGGYTLSAADRHDLYVGPDAFRSLFKWLPVAAEHLGETRFKMWPPKGFPDSWNIKRRWRADEVTPFEQMRVLEPEPDLANLEVLRTRFSKRFPHIGKPEIAHTWAGMIDSMPDVVPIVDHVPNISGLIVATGMSGHGFGIGPGFGKIVGKLVAGKPVGHDISRFRFSRFSDGSKLRPGPSI